MDEKRIDIECDSVYEDNFNREKYYNINLNLDESMFGESISKLGLSIMSRYGEITVLNPNELDVINYRRTIINCIYLTWFLIEYKGYTIIFYVAPDGGFCINFIGKNNKACITKPVGTGVAHNSTDGYLIRSIHSSVAEWHKDSLDDLIQAALYVRNFLLYENQRQQLYSLFHEMCNIIYRCGYSHRNEGRLFDVDRTDVPIYIKIKPGTVIRCSHE